jgi:hypothetical protein
VTVKHALDGRYPAEHKLEQMVEFQKKWPEGDLLWCIDTHSCSLTGNLVVGVEKGVQTSSTVEEVRWMGL